MAGLVLFALAATAAPATYPVKPIWNAFISFCSARTELPSGWTKFAPEPNTSLAYLAEGQSWLFPGRKNNSAIVYRSILAGRTLFAFKRQIGSVESCQLYDFAATQRLDTTAWSKVAGLFSNVNERKYTQELRFEAAHKLRRPQGSITFHQKGYFPPLDSIGFVGLQLVAISRESL